MTLTFMTRFPDSKPKFNQETTMFVEKIVQGLYLTNKLTASKLVEPFRREPTTGFEFSVLATFVDTLPKIWEGKMPKLHTIRGLGKNGETRWKKGNKIHFKIWTGKPRKSKTFAFAPVVECTAVQKITIQYEHVSNEKNSKVIIAVDGVVLTFDEAKELAINDGFHSLREFLWWFNEDFEGVIIHWTPKRYGAVNIEVTEAKTIKPVCFRPVKPEEFQVSQFEIKEVLAAENELINGVLEDHLKRKPTMQDVEKCTRLMFDQSQGYKYELMFDQVKLGVIESEAMENGGVKFIFNGEPRETKI